MLTQLNKMH